MIRQAVWIAWKLFKMIQITGSLICSNKFPVVLFLFLFCVWVCANLVICSHLNNASNNCWCGWFWRHEQDVMFGPSAWTGTHTNCTKEGNMLREWFCESDQSTRMHKYVKWRHYVSQLHVNTCMYLQSLSLPQFIGLFLQNI